MFKYLLKYLIKSYDGYIKVILVPLYLSFHQHLGLSTDQCRLKIHLLIMKNKYNGYPINLFYKGNREYQQISKTGLNWKDKIVLTEVGYNESEKGWGQNNDVFCTC